VTAQALERTRRFGRVLGVVYWSYLAGVVVLFLGSIASNGLPSLRHDWVWPAHRVDYVRAAFDGINGWSGAGIGSYNLHPLNYLGVIPMMLAMTVFGSPLAFIAEVAWTAALIVAGALALSTDASAMRRAAVVTFALFNPWVYTQVVAGHLFMVNAYGAAMLLLAALRRPAFSRGPATLALGVIAAQPQFFVWAMSAVAWNAGRRRTFWALAAGVALAVPAIIVAVLLSTGVAESDPTVRTWIESQAVAPLSALALTGYFTHYAAAFDGIPTLGVYVVAAVALLGLVTSGLPTFARGVVAFGIPFAVAVSIGPALLPLEVHIRHLLPISGLFREGYDLIGIVAVGYVFFCSRVRPDWRWLDVLLAASVVLLVPVWIWQPVSRFWVSHATLPEQRVAIAENMRFVTLPGLQPLNYRRQGSGVDPDAFPRAGNRTPLNEYHASYPVDAAIAAYERDGETALLRQLSVGEAIQRPGYRSDVASLSQQVAAERGRRPPGPDFDASRNAELGDALPELVLRPAPTEVSRDVRSLKGEVFFGDAQEWPVDTAIGRIALGHRFVRVSPSSGSIDPQRDWIDARLVFVERPELAQGFGGAYTLQSRATLDVLPNLALYASVDGRLEDDRGRLVTRSTHGYAWIDPPHDARAVRCVGTCVVGGQGIPAGNAGAPSHADPRGVAFVAIAPWLAYARLPATGSDAVLQYNVRYAPTWRALAFGHGWLPHVRLDALTNGWRVAPREGGTLVLFVETVSLLQLLAQILGIAVLIVAARASAPLARRAVRSLVSHGR
jgi:hypothetical protein